MSAADKARTWPVRVSALALDHLSGTGSWQAISRGNVSDWEEADMLMADLWRAKPRADGSVHVRLTADEAAVLANYTGAWLAGAHDSIDRDDASTLAEYNSARALEARLGTILWESRRG